MAQWTADPRGIAQPFIQWAVEAGWGANETLEALRGEGVGYRRTTFLSDFRTYLDQLVNRPYVTGMADTDFIPKGMITNMPPSQMKFRTGNYRYEFEAYYMNPATGEYVSETLAWGSDEYLSKEQATLEFLSYTSGSPPAEEYELAGAQLLGAYHQWGTPW